MSREISARTLWTMGLRKTRWSSADITTQCLSGYRGTLIRAVLFVVVLIAGRGVQASVIAKSYPQDSTSIQMPCDARNAPVFQAQPNIVGCSMSLELVTDLSDGIYEQYLFNAFSLNPPYSTGPNNFTEQLVAFDDPNPIRINKELVNDPCVSNSTYKCVEDQDKPPPFIDYRFIDQSRDIKVRTKTNALGVRGSTTVPGIDFVEGSPSYLIKSTSLTPNDHFFTFSFIFKNSGDGDYFTMSVGNEILFSTFGDTYGSNDEHQVILDISSWAGKDNAIFSFILHSVGSPNAVLFLPYDSINLIETSDVNNAASIPEPYILLVFLLVVAILSILHESTLFRTRATVRKHRIFRTNLANTTRFSIHYRKGEKFEA
jgi:hypothetical protein